jgi:hypothetical protein
MGMLRRCVAAPNSAADMRGMVCVRTVQQLPVDPSAPSTRALEETNVLNPPRLPAVCNGTDPGGDLCASPSQDGSGCCARHANMGKSAGNDTVNAGLNAELAAPFHRGRLCGSLKADDSSCSTAAWEGSRFSARPGKRVDASAEEPAAAGKAVPAAAPGTAGGTGRSAKTGAAGSSLPSSSPPTSSSPPAGEAASGEAASGEAASLRGERETVAARAIAAGSVGPYSGLVLCDKEVTSVLSRPRQLLTLLHFW